MNAMRIVDFLSFSSIFLSAAAVSIMVARFAKLVVRTCGPASRTDDMVGHEAGDSTSTAVRSAHASPIDGHVDRGSSFQSRH